MEKEQNMQPVLLDVNAAAFLLGGVCPKTVLNLVDRGFLKPVYISRRRLFRRTDLERLARTGTK
jgi:hypothetical protein